MIVFYNLFGNFICYNIVLVFVYLYRNHLVFTSTSIKIAKDMKRKARFLGLIQLENSINGISST
jgi:hypothetical protein